jgi:hypothetical protein
MTENRADKLGQIVEHEVRQLIGDLQMQIIVLRAALNNLQQHPQEQPPKQPQPIPPQPEQPPPEKKEPAEEPEREHRSMNGQQRYQEKIAR